MNKKIANLEIGKEAPEIATASYAQPLWAILKTSTMKIYLIMILIIVIFISCNKREKLQFERFSLVASSWRCVDTIWTIRVVGYIELNDNNGKYIYSNFPMRKECFYNAHVSDKLITLINQNFTNISLDTVPPPRYDLLYNGWSYCYCVKIKGQKEKYYYYNPYSLPNAWKGIYYTLDSLFKSDTTEVITKPHDFQKRLELIKSQLESHKTSFPPPPIKRNIKFVPPEIKPDGE